MDLLARTSNGDPVMWVFGGIILVIWLVSAIVSSLNKKAQEIRRRTQFGQLPPDLSRRGYAGAGPAPTYGGTPGYPVPPPPPPSPKRRKNRGGGGGGAGSLGATASAPLLSRAGAISAATASESAAPPAAPPAAAARPSRIARLARRPDTLRAAFILSEVLAPPKSLRNESGQQL